MGKKRNNTAARYPGGQIKYDRPRPHRQRVIAYSAMMNDPRFKSQITLLHAAGKLTDSEKEVAEAYQDAREDYRQAMGFAPPFARGQDLSAVRGLVNLPDDDEQRERREKAEKRLTAMELAIGHNSAELRAVQWVCGEDRFHETYEQFLALKSGLGRLVIFRRQGKRR